MKAAIIIVVYNTAEFIVKQVECIRRFCKENPNIIIIDNSSKQEVSDAIVYRIQNLNCIYEKVTSHSGNPSLSHAFAANHAYHKYYLEYDYVMMLDHDAFPIVEFSMEKILEGGKLIAGMTQFRRSGKVYFWPGCLIISNALSPELIDFSPNEQYGLDTGGNLYKAFEKFPKHNFVFFDEHTHENIHFKQLHHNKYTVIGKIFMHFIAGSNWNNLPKEEYDARISGLMAILNDTIGGTNA